MKYGSCVYLVLVLVIIAVLTGCSDGEQQAVIPAGSPVGDYEFGFKIADVDPIEDGYVAKEVLIGSLFDVEYRDGYAFVANDGKGMSVIDVDPVEDTYLLSWVEVIGEPYMGGMAIDDNILYLAGHEAGLHIIQLW